MLKKIGILIMVLLFLGVYFTVFSSLISSNISNTDDVYYTKNEFGFGSDSLLVFFIVMTIILLMYCNYFINLFIAYKNKKQGKENPGKSKLHEK